MRVDITFPAMELSGPQITEANVPDINAKTLETTCLSINGKLEELLYFHTANPGMFSHMLQGGNEHVRFQLKNARNDR